MDTPSIFLQSWLAMALLPTSIVTVISLLVSISLALLYTAREPVIASVETPPQTIPGFTRLGLIGRSNLADQFLAQKTPSNSHPPLPSTSPQIKALFTYPVKSCQGIELSSSTVERTGLQYDRLFTFAHLMENTPNNKPHSAAPSTRRWKFLTQREAPRLALISTELWLPTPASPSHDENKHHYISSNTPSHPPHHHPHPTTPDISTGYILLRIPHNPPLTIHFPLHIPSASTLLPHESLTIWTDTILARNITSLIPSSALLSLQAFLRTRAQIALFRIDDAALRPVTRSLPPPSCPRPQQPFAIALADAFPIHILSLPSVAAVDAAQRGGGGSVKGRLDALRFRANVYLEGCAAFEEDEWTKVRIGEERESGGRDGGGGVYHVACRTARCGIVGIDPESGLRKGAREVEATLKRTRRVDRGAWPYACLGMMIVPLFEGEKVVRVGEGVGVLERGEHVYEKMYP